MNQPDGTSRETLYQKWFEWVMANLGHDNELAGIAATAATDAIEAERGFNTATESARTAWTEAAARRGPESRGMRRWRSWRSFGCGLVLGIAIGATVAIVGVIFWFVVAIGPAFGPGF